MSIKHIILTTLLMISGITYTSTPSKNGWTCASAEQKEYDKIMHECNLIWMEALKISRYPDQGYFRKEVTFLYLKNLGTPVAFKVLQDLVARGILPKSDLDRA